MTRVYVHEPKKRKELPDEGEHIICNVWTLSAANEETLLLEPSFLWVFERKISHIWERFAKNIEWDAKLLSASFGGSVKISKEKLSYLYGLQTMSE